MNLIYLRKRVSRGVFVAKRYLIAGFGIMLFFASPVSATTMRANMLSTDIPLDQDVVIPIVLETGGELINAVEGVLYFESAGISMRDIRIGGSEVPFWIVSPVIENEEVRFSGVIPGGRTDDVMLFSIVVRGDASGTAHLSAKGIRVLLNDGKGTETSSSFDPMTIVAKEGAVLPSGSILEEDKESPEEFIPEIVKDDALSDGAYTLVFLTQDKNSGIDRYEIFETRREMTASEDVAWKTVTSPYRIQDQSLKSYIFIRAIDREGNVRLVRIDPQVPLAWYERSDFSAILFACVIAVLTVVGIIVLISWRVKRYET